MYVHVISKSAGFSTTGEKYKISASDHMYAVDMSMFNNKVFNSKKYNVISMNVSGGVVVPNPEPVFVSHPSGGGENIVINIADFAALYPNTMIFTNVCQSVAAYNSKFGVRVDDVVCNPFNPKYINILASPIKINDSYLAVFVAVIKPTVKKSVTATLIYEIMEMRNATKKLKKAAEERGDYITATICDFLQLALKLLVNTLYGVLLFAGYVTYRPYLASLITNYGRIQLIRFLFSLYHYIQSQGVETALRGALGGDTDSLFFRCTPSEMNVSRILISFFFIIE